MPSLIASRYAGMAYVDQCQQGWPGLSPLQWSGFGTSQGFLVRWCAKCTLKKCKPLFFPRNMSGNIYCSPSGIWALLVINGTLLRPSHSGVYIRLREQLIEEILIWNNYHLVPLNRGGQKSLSKHGGRCFWLLRNPDPKNKLSETKLVFFGLVPAFGTGYCLNTNMLRLILSRNFKIYICSRYFKKRVTQWQLKFLLLQCP